MASPDYGIVSEREEQKLLGEATSRDLSSAIVWSLPNNLSLDKLDLIVKSVLSS